MYFYCNYLFCTTFTDDLNKEEHLIKRVAVTSIWAQHLIPLDVENDVKLPVITKHRVIKNYLF
jgi:hypothetical protein